MDNGDLSWSTKTEVGEIRNLIQHIEHLKQERRFPSEASKFRHDTIIRKSYMNFKRSSIGTKLLRSSWCISTNPPLGLAGSSGSSGINSQQLTIIQENKHVLENLFSLEPNSWLQVFLMDKDEHRIGIDNFLFDNDHLTKDKNLQLIGIKNYYHMTSDETSLMGKF